MSWRCSARAAGARRRAARARRRRPRGARARGRPRRAPRGRPAAAPRGARASTRANGSVELGERVPAPQAERLAQPRRAARRVAARRAPRGPRAQRAEAVESTPSGVGHEHVAGRLRLQRAAGQHLAQLRDVDLHHLGRRRPAPRRPTGRRSAARPRPCGSASSTRRASSARCLRPPSSTRAAPVGHLERAEDAKLHADGTLARAALFQRAEHAACRRIYFFF